MAINLDIYSNTNTVTKSISVDFFADLLSDSITAPSDQIVYYFKLSTSARDTANLPYNIRIAKGLDALALNKAKQSSVNSAANYTSIDTMIKDYVYDYVYGHTADQYSSGVTAKAPMKF